MYILGNIYYKAWIDAKFARPPAGSLKNLLFGLCFKIWFLVFINDMSITVL